MKKINYIDKEICKECTKICCTYMPGTAAPEDFDKPLKESITKALGIGNWVIDYYEGGFSSEDSNIYFLRPATTGKEHVIVDPSWGGTCVFLARTGCSLDDYERPKGCRVLKPVREGCCIAMGGDKKETALWWKRHQKLLIKIMEEITKEEIK